MKGYLMNYSNLNSLRYCTERYPCGNRLCPYCAPLLASRTRASLRAEGANDATVLFAVLSVASSTSLEIAYDDLSRTIAAFTKNGWISQRSRSWNRHTEVIYNVVSGSWHPHINLLVYGTPAQLADLQSDLVAHWIKSATKAGVAATAEGQKVLLSSSIATVARYATKSLLTLSKTPETSLSPGDLLARATTGDADAADLWEELETLFRTRHPRLVATGGQMSAKTGAPHSPARTPRTGRPRLATLHDLEKLQRSGLTLKQLADRVGLSESTIVRRLREIRNREEKAVAA